MSKVFILRVIRSTLWEGNTPCNVYGHRIVVGSRRPKGAPPMVSRGLSSRNKAKVFATCKDEGRPPASSTDVLGATALEGTRSRDLSMLQERFACEDFVEERFQAAVQHCRTSDLRSGGGYTDDGPEERYHRCAGSRGYPTQHRNRAPPIFPSAIICRPVSKKE